jgi:poly(A) polymerase
LLFRYGATENGTIEKKAHIYTQEEHAIDPSLLDEDAAWVVRRLRKEGYHAYVVGGAVRDLMVGRSPNDFDVATDAHPQQIRRHFRSARIIGRRFRLVHVYCSKEKYIEVTTFRSRSAAGTTVDAPFEERNNLFGTMEEDAERRDFTVNALYYCPIDRQVIDYVGGVPDIRNRRLRTLVAADASFAEDPVRMIRAVKYASLLGFPIPLAMAGLIKRMGQSILTCSRERVTEEVFKILSSGAAADILDLAHRLRLFDIMFPGLAGDLREKRKRPSDSPLWTRLRDLDARTKTGTALDRNDMFRFLFLDLVRDRGDLLDGEDPQLLIQQFIRTVSEPLFPSKKDLAVAADSILKEERPHLRLTHRPRETGARAPRSAAAVHGEAGQTGRRRKRKRGRRRGGGAGQDAASPQPRRPS